MGTSSPRPSGVAPYGAVRLAVALMVALIAVVMIGTSTARAATALSWTRSTTSGPTVKGPLALSCASSSLCVAVDAGGDALVSSDPGSAATWTPVTVSAGKDLTGVSCPSTGECVAVDTEGEVFATTAPSGTWKLVADETGHELTSVSCGSTALCVAVAADGYAFVSSDPAQSGSWTGSDIDAAKDLSSVSCASSSLCVAVDESGNALASANPTGAWSTQPITPGDSPLLAVSCETSGACAATDEAGYALISTNPTAASSSPDTSGPEWSAADLNASALSSLSCVPGLCVTANASGESLASEDLGARPAQWSGSAVGSAESSQLDAISCVPAAACVALAAPAGEGSLEAFSASVPMMIVEPPPPPPPPKEEPPVVSLVTPNPGITGDAAAGQTLSCSPGLPAGASATVTYQWLANTSPIAGATNPKYKVRSKDEGDHLQCEVTATNAAGSVQQTSSAVAVPRVQALVSVGETTVGKASAETGKVSFTVDCSAKAVGSCKIDAALTLYERLRGTKVIGVSATKPAQKKDAAPTKGVERTKDATPGKESTTTEKESTTKVEPESKAEKAKAATKERVTEVTVGSLKLEVKLGHTRTVTLRLNAAGRKLARERKRVPAKLTVSGTVIGVLTGTLRSQTLHVESAAKTIKAKVKSGRLR